MDGEQFITETWQVKGMTCVNCQNTIERALQATAGVQEAHVSYNKGTARVRFDSTVLTASDIVRVIRDAGYDVVADADKKANSAMPDLIGLLLVIIALFLLIQHFGLTRFFSSVPLVSEGMNYGALFVLGLVTSLHCMAMCGGLQLSVGLKTVGTPSVPTGRLVSVCAANKTDANRTTSERRGLMACSAENGSPEPFSGRSATYTNQQRSSTLLPAILYNLGRVLSYTAVGAIVGALGGVISFNGTAKGIVQIVAGLFMLIMGFNMLGVAPAFLRKLTPRMPAFLTRGLHSTTTTTTPRTPRTITPLIVGLLNGLMPCGPLQAMQIFALSTGSPLKGAAAMFFFALGTVPLMFGLGALSGLLSKRFTRSVLQFGSVIVTVLGLVVLTTGLSLSGVWLPRAIAPAANVAQTDGSGAAIAQVEGSGANAVQTVTTTLPDGQYQPITVQAGIPVRWTVTARDADINGCNKSIVIPAMNVEYEFHPGDNLIEFTPTKAGTYVYTCWMGMISSTITVLGTPDETDRTPTSVTDTQKGLRNENQPEVSNENQSGRPNEAVAAACPCCAAGRVTGSTATAQ